ncbi:MAG: 50S ribosomal protein L4 [Deltaproteobacteria bacterium]|nr:50S ribosomal protein L4 [Deltaproteobacteria bacterium]
MNVDVINKEAQKVGSIELPDDVFAAEVNQGILWEQVKSQRASRRRGTHSTKTRANVSGGGIKPFKQKGTGQARQGSIRAPNHVGGGNVFGPHPRDYSYRLPRSARRAALRSALSLRAKENSVMVLDTFKIDKPKTKAVIEFLGKIKVDSALLVDVENHGLKMSTRNLPSSKFVEVEGLNVYDILDYDKLVLTREAVPVVIELAKNKRGPKAD